MLFGLADASEKARRLAGVGIDGVFTFEGPHDPFVPLARVAGEVDVDLMTNVAIAFARNPMQTAHLANDIQEIARGRFRLGLGTQIRPAIEKRYGADFDRPVTRMREFVAALRAIFACWNEGERLDFRGDFFHHTLMTPIFNPGPNPWGPPPVYLGALGPRMTEMAAEVADGLLVMPFNSKRHFEERTLPAVARGLAKAGRGPEDLAIEPEVIVSCGRDEQELSAADAATRTLLGFYGSTPAYRPVLDAEGWADLQPELNRLSKEGRWDVMAELIDDDILETIAVRGTPGEVAAEIADRFGVHAGRVGFYTPYAPADDVLAEIVEALRDASRQASRLML